MHNFTKTQIAQALAKLEPPTYITTHTRRVRNGGPFKLKRIFFLVRGIDPFGSRGGRGKFWRAGEVLRDKTGAEIAFDDLESAEEFGEAEAKKIGCTYVPFYDTPPLPVGSPSRHCVWHKRLLRDPEIGASAISWVGAGGERQEDGSYKPQYYVRALAVLDPGYNLRPNSPNVLKVLYESPERVSEDDFQAEVEKAHRIADAFDQKMFARHGPDYYERYYPEHCTAD